MTFNPVPKPKHKRRKPTRAQRNAFPKKVRDRIMEENNHCCQSCGRRATQIHHVQPRSRSGRGVYTNGMAICNDCHTKIHQDNEMMRFWQQLYETEYGKDYYKDEYDD